MITKLKILSVCLLLMCNCYSQNDSTIFSSNSQGRFVWKTPTQVRTALNLSNLYQPIGSYPTGTGTVSGSNTGDNATNSQYSGLAATKQNNISLTTTGTSGAATFNGTTLNIPNYTVGVGVSVYAQVTGSNATTTGQVLVDVTGLSVALTNNAVYEFEAVMSCQTTAVTTGTAYGVQYNAAGATIEASISGASTSTAMKNLRISAFNSATSLYLATSGQTGGIIIKGRVTTGVNPGNLTIQHLKLTSGTSTVMIGSFLKVTRIS